MSATALREAAAFLLQQADELEGKPVPSGFDVNDRRTWWPAMLAQFAAEDARVADEREIGSIVTRYKPVIDAAHREHWPSNLGGSYWLGNYKTAPALLESLIALMQTEQYKKWAADPLNANLVPKAPPA